MAIPMSYLWWSFAKEDAEMRTTAIMKKKRWQGLAAQISTGGGLICENFSALSFM
jgi:hypothetical protein